MVQFKRLLLEDKYYDFSLYRDPEIDEKAVKAEYMFNSNIHDYQALLRKSAKLNDDKEVEFWISAAYKRVWSNTAREMTGEGNARKVIRTFFEIVKDFVDRFWDRLDDEFLGIMISSVGQNEEMERKKHRVYKRFSEIYFSNKRIEEEGTDIFIWIEEKEK